MARLRRRRAKPFLINIRCGIPIPLMGRAAAWTGPQPITQGDGMVDEATDMTAFGGREKAVDMVYVRPVLLGSVAAAAAGALMQNLHNVRAIDVQVCFWKATRPA